MSIFGIIKNNFSKKAKNEASQSQNGTISLNPSMEELKSLFHNGIIGGAPLNSATYYACMKIRCDALSKTPIHVMNYSEEKGTEKIRNHPLYEVLHLRPNPYQTIHDFLWATEFQRLHLGNAYWVYQINKNKIKHLYVLDSNRVQIYIDDAGILSKNKNSVFYSYLDPRAGEIFYNSDQICHFKNFATDGIKGRGIPYYLRDTIVSENMGQQVINQKYEAGMQDPIVVIYTGDLNDRKKVAIQKKFADMGGVSNAGKVIPVAAGCDVRQLETKLVNSQFFELTGLTTKRIANAFGVKSFQLNDLEKSSYNSIEQENKSFYCDTMQDTYILYEQVINYILMTSYERENGIFAQFNADAILRSSLLDRVTSYSTATGTPYMTVAEARRLENLPFIPGTDKLVVSNGASIFFEQLGLQYEGRVK